MREIHRVRNLYSNKLGQTQTTETKLGQTQTTEKGLKLINRNKRTGNITFQKNLRIIKDQDVYLY